MCTRVVVLDDGRVVMAGPALQVLEDPAVAERGVPVLPKVALRRALEGVGLDSAVLHEVDR